MNKVVTLEGKLDLFAQLKSLALGKSVPVGDWTSTLILKKYLTTYMGVVINSHKSQVTSVVAG